MSKKKEQLKKELYLLESMRADAERFQEEISEEIDSLSEQLEFLSGEASFLKGKLGQLEKQTENFGDLLDKIYYFFVDNGHYN